MSDHRAPLPRATKRTLDRWLLRRAGPARRALAGAVVAGSLGGIALIGQCWLVARVVDGVVVHRATLSEVMPFLLTLLATFVFRAAAAVVSDTLAFDAGTSVVLAVRAELHAHLAALGPAWTRLQPAGALAETAVGAVDSLGRYYAGYLPQTMLVAVVPLAILAFVVPTDWVSGLIMTLSAPLVPLFMIILGKGAEALNQAQWRTLARLSGHVFDAIEGLTTLRLFNASRAEIGVIARLSDEYRQATMAVLRVAFLSSLVLEFLATVSIAMVAVYIGFRLYYGDMHLLPGLAVLLVAPEFYRMLRAMGTQYHARMEAIGAADAVTALLGAVPAPRPGGDTPVAAPALVRLEDVAFAHGDAGAVLDGVSLALARGRVVALVGPSGTGKTTLAELLLGFHAPARGRITVDGADLASLSTADWRRSVAWLPQRPTLFHGTLRDNLRLGRPDAADEALWRALALAAADDLVAALPRGLDTVLGEAGQGLSGGEAQRIALARTFVKEASVLVLDEPMAGLDAPRARRVGEAIRRSAERSAVLVIAHDDVAVGLAGEVVSLAGGRLVPRAGLAAAAPEGVA